MEVVPDIVDPGTDICQGTIDMLERWLEDVRAGRVCDVMIGGDTGDGVVVNASATLDCTRQLGLLELIRAHIIRHIQDENG